MIETIKAKNLKAGDKIENNEVINAVWMRHQTAVYMTNAEGTEEFLLLDPNSTVTVFRTERAWHLLPEGK